MNLFTDPRSALTIARQHQADVRAAFPRRLPRPTFVIRPKPHFGGVTAVPAIPDGTVAEGTVPAPRSHRRQTAA